MALRGTSSALFAASIANAVDLEGMAGSEVLVFASHLAFDALDVGGEKFDRAAALGTDHVMMVAAIVLMLVAGDAIVEGDFAGQAAFGQKLQRAVYRRKADALILLAHQTVEIVRGEVVSGVEEGAQDGIALTGVLQADTMEMIVKHGLGFAQHLRRNRRLVIHALLRRLVHGFPPGRFHSAAPVRASG